MISSTIAYENSSCANTQINAWAGFGNEPRRNRDIFEGGAELERSMMCSQKSQAGPLSHHIHIMWEHIRDGGRLRTKRCASDSMENMDPRRRGNICRIENVDARQHYSCEYRRIAHWTRNVRLPFARKVIPVAWCLLWSEVVKKGGG